MTFHVHGRRPTSLLKERKVIRTVHFPKDGNKIVSKSSFDYPLGSMDRSHKISEEFKVTTKGYLVDEINFIPGSRFPNSDLSELPALQFPDDKGRQWRLDSVLAVDFPDLLKIDDLVQRLNSYARMSNFSIFNQVLMR